MSASIISISIICVSIISKYFDADDDDDNWHHWEELETTH